MRTLGERIRFLRGEETQHAFAASLGIPQMTLSNYETGKSEPKLVLLKELCSRFGLNVGWLLFGVGSMSAKHTNSEQTKETELTMVPMVEARLSAGSGSLQVDGTIERSYAFRSEFLRRKGNPKNMVMMRVEGDSMQPEIMNGDVVLLDQDKKNIRIGRIFAVGFDEAIYLKRIDQLPGKIILKSVNPDYPPLELDVREQNEDSFRVIGQVIWCGREYR